jgi:WhiB family redox-sensing transcriptional regulator
MKSQTLDEFLELNPREFNDTDSDRFVSFKFEDLWPTWQARAHCRDVGVKYYFGDEEQLPMSIKAVRRAAKLCDVCPVYTECLRWALERREEYGVWAGTSGRVRRRIFSLLDNGMTTVDDVIEVFLNGGADQYRRTPAPAEEAPGEAEGCSSEVG